MVHRAEILKLLPAYAIAPHSAAIWRVKSPQLLIAALASEYAKSYCMAFGDGLTNPQEVQMTGVDVIAKARVVSL